MIFEHNLGEKLIMRIIAKKKKWIIAQISGIIVSRLREGGREGGREGLDRYVTYIHTYIHTYIYMLQCPDRAA